MTEVLLLFLGMAVLLAPIVSLVVSLLGRSRLTKAEERLGELERSRSALESELRALRAELGRRREAGEAPPRAPEVESRPPVPPAAAVPAPVPARRAVSLSEIAPIMPAAKRPASRGRL